METLNIVNQLLTKYNIKYTYILFQKEKIYYVTYGIKDYNNELFNLFKDEIKEIDGCDGWNLTGGGDENDIEDLNIRDGEFYERVLFLKS